MGLIAVLITSLIIALVALFGWMGNGKKEGGGSVTQVKQTVNEAQQVSDKVHDNSKIEYEQSKKIDGN